jgi:hypothetical protein
VLSTQARLHKRQGKAAQEHITNDSTSWTVSTLPSIGYVNTRPGAGCGSYSSGGCILVKFKFLPGNRYGVHLYVQANT